MSKDKDDPRLGEWIQRRREALGIKSAAALAKKADLSVNYVSIVERGERVPRWETATTLADALELDQTGRERFFRAINAADQPEIVRDAIAGPAPGLALWKHLPSGLQVKPHDEPEWLSPDYSLAEAVPAIGAVLAWVALKVSHPNKRAATQISDAVSAALCRGEAADAEEARLFAVHTDRWSRLHGAMAVAEAWRRHVFSERASTARLLRHLENWSLRDRPDRGGISLLLSLKLAGALDPLLSVDQIDPRDIRNLHDFMVTDYWWSHLGLDNTLGLIPGNFAAWHLGKHITCDVPHLAEVDLDWQRDKLLLLANDGDRQALSDEHLRLRRSLYYARFAARILDVPGLGAKVFGGPPLDTWSRERLLARCSQVEDWLRGVTPELHDRLAAASHRLPA